MCGVMIHLCYNNYRTYRIILTSCHLVMTGCVTILFYVCEYWYSLKMARDSSRNMWDCFYVQQLVPNIGDMHVYNIQVFCFQAFAVFQL